MAENGVPVNRVINAGGIPQNNRVLNQVYANVLSKTVLVPKGSPTGLGSAIMAFVVAGIFPSIEVAQDKLCLPFQEYRPNPKAVLRYERLYQLYKKVYFSLGERDSDAAALGDVLPELRDIANEARRCHV
jgi:L-ribulokinase